MVKRIALRPKQRLSIISENPAYQSWPDMDPEKIALIGRVVWAGRKIA